MTTNDELVRQGYAAFGTGDMDALRAMFAPDAVHSVSGNTPISGDYKGVDEILGFYGQLFERTGGTFKAELKSAKAEGNSTVVAVHHETGTRGDKSLDQDCTLTFTIADGKLTRLVDEHADQDAYDAFFAD